MCVLLTGWALAGWASQQALDQGAALQPAQVWGVLASQPCELPTPFPLAAPCRCSATASFHRCVEVLVKHGLRCTPKVMESTKEPVEDMPHALRPPLRDVIQHFVEASLAADASARSGEVPGGAAAAAAAAGPSGATPASSSASQAPPPRRCAHCGTAEGKLLKCRGCRVAYFCSDDCQKANWPAHKAACKQAQRQRVAAEGGGTQDAPAGSA